MSSPQSPRLAVVLDEVLDEFRKTVERRIAEALEAARSLLGKSYEEALGMLKRRLNENLREMEERLRSVEALHDVEYRREISSLKAKLVNDTLKEALARLPEYVPRSQYEAFMRRLLNEAKSRGGSVRIIPVARDKELVTRLARELGLTVSEETREGYGGFIAVTETGAILDYTLESVLSSVIDESKSIIARELFPS